MFISGLTVVMKKEIMLF